MKTNTTTTKTSVLKNRISDDVRLLEKMFTLSIYLWIGVLAILCLIPFWLMVIGSFTAEGSLAAKGYQLFPTEFSLQAYKALFESKQLYSSYKVTILITIIGTVLSVAITAMMAYVMANPKVKYRNHLSFMVYFTMLFGPGLVGFYILIANWLHLKNSIWAMILPGLFGPWNAFLMVSYFRTIPFELNEAATVDGANEIYIFFRIYWPISTPIIATVGLFVALSRWNEWFNALLFIDKDTLHPLQIMIRKLMSNINAQEYIQSRDMDIKVEVPRMGIQLSTVCLTIGPILLLYPYVQKYFVKGLTIGSIKG